MSKNHYFTLSVTNSYTASYNSDQQILSENNPDGTLISYGYDAAGTPVTTTLPTGSYVSTFDPISGLPKSIVSPDGLTRTLGYDGTMVNTITLGGTISGTLGYTYDNLYRLTSDTVDGSSL